VSSRGSLAAGGAEIVGVAHANGICDGCVSDLVRLKGSRSAPWVTLVSRNVSYGRVRLAIRPDAAAAGYRATGEVMKAARRMEDRS
jgi:hypothetical protein